MFGLCMLIDLSIFWNSKWQSARRGACTHRIQKLIFMHLFTDLFCEDISTLVKINLTGTVYNTWGLILYLHAHWVDIVFYLLQLQTT